MNEFLPITLAIPTINRTNPFFDTINSLISCKYHPKEILILDQNNSELFEKLDSFLNRNQTFLIGTEIKHIKLDKCGSSYARNQAFAYATNSILVFSDDDVIFENFIFKNIYQRMQSKNVSMIAGIDYNRQQHFSLFSKLLLPFLGLDSFNKNKGKVTFGLFGVFPKIKEIIMSTEWAMGYLMVVRKEDVLLSKISFEEKFSKYGYAEDLDFSYRFFKWCKSKKKHCIIDPKIGVKHMVSSQNRIPSTELYLKVFTNRQVINFKLHKKHIFYRFILSWSNFWYRLLCKRKDKNNSVNIAYKLFKKHKHNLIKGILKDSYYQI